MGNTHSIYKVPYVKEQSYMAQPESKILLNKRTAAEEKRRLMSTESNIDELVHINYLYDQMELHERFLTEEHKLVQMIKNTMKTDTSPKYPQLLAERTLLLNSHWKIICEWEEISPVPPVVDLTLLERVYDSDIKMML
jgi:hypothetical protein